MKILFTPSISYKNSTHYSSNNVFKHNTYVSTNEYKQNYQIPFLGLPIIPKEQQVTQKAYEEAEKYLQYRKGILTKRHLALTLSNFNLSRLNGIQRGIKVFKGLSMKEIAFLYDHFYNVSISRGCGNRCAHCYAEAVPQHFAQDSDKIRNASFEDFKSLMKGIKTLNKRLGFQAIKENNLHSQSLFYDSDSIESEMLDKAGKIYDFTEANDLLYDATHIAGIFDTTGWHPKNEKYQKRAEKIVDYLLAPENAKKVHEVNISINPFHGIIDRANQFRIQNNDELAKKFKKIYIERMANAIFTFTPLVDKPNFGFINRALSRDIEGPEGYTGNDLKEIIRDVLLKVERMYVQDFKTERKYIKDFNDYFIKMDALKDKLQVIEPATSGGRAEQLYTFNPERLKRDRDLEARRIQILNNTLRASEASFLRGVDVNGKVWLFDFYRTIPTEIQLNYANRSKITNPYEKQIENLVITRQMIERDY